MKHVTDLFDLTFFKLVKLMHHGIQRQRLVCATSFCVLKWFFCLSHSSCLACKKMGVITAWWGVCSRSWYPFIDRVQVYKTQAKQSPPLLCCISDLTAAIRCGCVSLLEYVFSMCWPQVVCILCYLLSLPQCVCLYASPLNN